MDFAKFYNEQKEYTEYRTNKAKRDAYLLEVRWKVENLLQTIPSDRKFQNVLEVGCAFGFVLNEVADKLNITNRFGLDISTENIKVAKEFFPATNFICGTLESVDFSQYLPKGEIRFDLIVLSDIVEHIPDELDFMIKISKIAKTVILNLPLEKCFTSRNRAYGETDASGHLRCYSELDGLNLVAASKFKVINYTNKVYLEDEVLRNQAKEDKRKRVAQKTFLKRIFWKATYSMIYQSAVYFPIIPKRIYGSNLFCFLES